MSAAKKATMYNTYMAIQIARKRGSILMSIAVEDQI